MQAMRSAVGDQELVRPHHILLAFFEFDCAAHTLLTQLGITPENITATINELSAREA